MQKKVDGLKIRRISMTRSIHITNIGHAKRWIKQTSEAHVLCTSLPLSERVPETTMAIVSPFLHPWSSTAVALRWAHSFISAHANPKGAIQDGNWGAQNLKSTSVCLQLAAISLNECTGVSYTYTLVFSGGTVHSDLGHVFDYQAFTSTWWRLRNIDRYTSPWMVS